MSIQQEGVLELLSINDMNQSCLDVNSITSSLAIGMAKRGVQTYIENHNQDIIRCIMKQSKLEGVSNKISFQQSDDMEFDFILLTTNSVDVDTLHGFHRLLTSDGMLVLLVNNHNLGLLWVKRMLDALNFSDSQIYLPFGDNDEPTFILPKKGFEKYYYRYWSWRHLNIWSWPNKLVEYFFVFKLRQLWVVSNYIVLLKN
jgi:hypothetical protein